MPAIEYGGADEHRADLRICTDADALDFPLQRDPVLFSHATADFFAQTFNVGSRRRSEVDEKIAVELGDLRATDPEAAAAGGVDQLPGFVIGRVLERRAAG